MAASNLMKGDSQSVPELGTGHELRLILLSNSAGQVSGHCFFTGSAEGTGSLVVFPRVAPLYRAYNSDGDPLHDIPRHFTTAAIVDPRGSRIRVASQVLHRSCANERPRQYSVVALAASAREEKGTGVVFWVIVR
jgi:hypothetical protein